MIDDQRKRAILFDFDGVLADTMEDNYKGWRSAFADYGISVKGEDYFPLEGAKLQEVVRILAEKYKIKDYDTKSIIRKKEDYFIANHRFSLYPGVYELVQELKEKFLIAIVSAAQQKRMFSTTPRAFLDCFNFIVTGDQLQRGKPYPDPYLRAMDALHVSPAETVVIENAPLGIQSAKSAGAYCIAIASTIHSSYLQGADEVVQKFSDLRNTHFIHRALQI